MSLWRVAGTALATIVLAGCMFGPNYVRGAPSLPASYPDAPPATVTSAAAPVVRPDWWTLYGDGTLDRLVTTALSDNLDVAVAVARIEEADALLREVNASLFPEVDLVGGAARSRSSSAVAAPSSVRISNDVRVALSTSFEIDLRKQRRVHFAQQRIGLFDPGDRHRDIEVV